MAHRRLGDSQGQTSTSKSIGSWQELAAKLLQAAPRVESTKAESDRYSSRRSPNRREEKILLYSDRERAGQSDYPAGERLQHGRDRGSLKCSELAKGSGKQR